VASQVLISIVIPVYNAEQYLAQSIESAINQTWNNKEIIIIDDCSTDISYSIAKRYESESIRIYRLNENKGQSYSSNYGLSKSSGQLIKFLDADDLIDSDYLSNMMKLYVDEQSLYFSHCVNFYNSIADGTAKSYNLEKWKNVLPVDFLLSESSNMMQGGRWLISRHLIATAGPWNEELSYINDYEFFTRVCLKAKQIYYCENAVLYYRQVPNSLSSQTTEKAYKSGYKAITIAATLLSEYEDSERVNRFIANAYQGLLYLIFPKYPELNKTISEKINNFGGADLEPKFGGKIIDFIAKRISWKLAKYLQHYKNYLELYF